MAAVKTDKQAYLFYQGPCQSNVDYLEAFKAHLRVRKSHDGAVVYCPVVAVVELQ